MHARGYASVSTLAFWCVCVCVCVLVCAHTRVYVRKHVHIVLFVRVLVVYWFLWFLYMCARVCSGYVVEYHVSVVLYYTHVLHVHLDCSFSNLLQQQ